MSIIQFHSIHKFATEINKKPLIQGFSSFEKMLETWGNGNRDIGFSIFYNVTMRLVHARNKHPAFAEGQYHALGVIGSEYRELEHAIEYETPERQRDEALDVIATCLRFYNGEHFDYLER